MNPGAVPGKMASNCWRWPGSSCANRRLLDLSIAAVISAGLASTARPAAIEAASAARAF
jgi:hypothetical protein